MYVLHGADEAGVEDDQRRARDDVDENHSRPVVHAVVDGLVASDERRLLVPTRRDFHSRRDFVVVDVLGGTDHRRDLDGAEGELTKPASL